MSFRLRLVFLDFLQDLKLKLTLLPRLRALLSMYLLSRLVWLILSYIVGMYALNA